jgi:uncharacterized protein YigA (DUF484 family)
MSDATRATKKAVDPETSATSCAPSPSSCATTRTCWASWACGSTPPTSSTSAPALARAAAAHKREASVRQAIEANARANFSAQAQTHAAVIDLLDARNHSDLARRVDEMSRCASAWRPAIMALEGPTRVPAGWHALAEGQVDMMAGRGADRPHGLLRPRPAAVRRQGRDHPQHGAGPHGHLGAAPRSPAGLRLDRSRGLHADMGIELVNFLARVVERTAERWPVL